MYKSIGSKIVKIDDRNPIMNESSSGTRTMINQYRLADHMSVMCSEISKLVAVRAQLDSLNGSETGRMIFDTLNESLNSVISNQIYVEGILDITKNISKGLNKFVSDNLNSINLYSKYIKKEGLDMLSYDSEKIFPMAYIPSQFTLNPNLRSLDITTLRNLNKMGAKTDVLSNSYSNRDIAEIANTRGYDDVKDFFLALADSNTWAKHTAIQRMDISIIDSFIGCEVEDGCYESVDRNKEKVTPLEVLSNCINIVRYLETEFMASAIDTDDEMDSDIMSRQDIFKMVGILIDVIFNVSVVAIMQNIFSLNKAINETAKKNAVVSRVELIKNKIAEIK